MTAFWFGFHATLGGFAAICALGIGLAFIALVIAAAMGRQ